MKEHQLSRDQKDSIIFIGVLVAFAITLSLFVFSRQSLRLDEAQSIWQASHSVAKLITIVAQDVHVPLYHLILHFWMSLFGTGVGAVRALSLIIFILTIPAVYFLGKLAYGRFVALFSVFIFAISPFSNWYGSETRMYSLLVLMTVLNQYFFLALYKKIKEPRQLWIGYILTAFLGLYTHYFFGMVLVVQAIFFVVFRKKFTTAPVTRFLEVAGILLILFGPWLVFVSYLGGFSNSAPSLMRPTTIDLFNTFSQFIFGFQNDHLNTILLSLWPLVMLLMILSLGKNSQYRDMTIYFMLSIFLPVIIAFVVSLTVVPVFISRYLILTLPALYIVLSWIFSTYHQPFSRVAKALLVIAMLVSLGVEAGSAVTPAKENYREAAEYLEQNASFQDVIAISAPFTIYPVEYYYHGSAELETLPIWDRTAGGGIPGYDEKTISSEIETLKGSHKVLWLLQSYDQGYEDKLRLYFDTHFERLSAKNFSHDLNLYAYKLRYD